jgi:Arc/MetJ-type ribon-helix-helix transcriptional regulator
MSNAAVLPEDLQALAEQLVRAGEYASVNDVAHEAFRLLQQRDKQRDEVREELATVFGEMDSGNYLEPSDDEFAHVVRDRALNHSAE